MNPRSLVLLSQSLGWSSAASRRLELGARKALSPLLEVKPASRQPAWPLLEAAGLPARGGSGQGTPVSPCSTGCPVAGGQWIVSSPPTGTRTPPWASGRAPLNLRGGAPPSLRREDGPPPRAERLAAPRFKGGMFKARARGNSRHPVESPGRGRVHGSKVEAIILWTMLGVFLFSALGCGLGIQRIEHVRAQRAMSRQLQQRERELAALKQTHRALEGTLATWAARQDQPAWGCPQVAAARPKPKTAGRS